MYPEFRVEQRHDRDELTWMQRRANGVAAAWKQYGPSIEAFPLHRTLASYRRSFLAGDIGAALNVALLAFPQGIAYALIAGVPLHYGLFGSIIACLLGGVFGKSTFVALGPTNATAILLLSALSGIALMEQKLVALPMVVLMSGIFLIVGALLGLSGFIRFVSRTVITGYITVAAILIILNQLRAAFGIELAEGEIPSTIVKAVYYFWIHLGETDPGTLAFSAVSLGVYLGLRSLVPRLPVVAIAIAVLSAIAFAWGYLFAPIGLLDPVTIGTWRFTPPPLDLDLASSVAGAALAVALLSVLEGQSIGKSLAARRGQRFDADQEIYSMGVANIGCALGSGIPASGSLTRSALNANSGARTPVSSIFTGIILLAAVLLIGDWIRFVPHAALAVIIICIGVSLINWAGIQFVMRATRQDAVAFLATVAAGVFFGLDAAIYAGVFLSIALFLRQASVPELVQYDMGQSGDVIQRRGEEETVPEVSIVHVEGDLFFAAADIFRDQIRRIYEDPNLRVVIVRLRNARHLDATCLMALEELLALAQKEERHLIVCGVRKSAFRAFYTTGMIKRIGRDNFFMESVANPTLSTARATKRAREILGDREARVTLYAGSGKKEGGGKA